MSEQYTITVDEEGRRVLVAALDLLQRVAMGQWREVAEASHGMLQPGQDGPFTEAGNALMEVRCRFAAHPALQNAANASLGIAESNPQARIACDLWRVLGGGMRDRSDMRLTAVPASIFPDPRRAP